MTPPSFRSNGQSPKQPPAPRAAAGKAADPFSASPLDIQMILNYLRVLRERWIWGALLGIVLGSLFAYNELRKEPVYTATANFLIESRSAQILDVEKVVDTNLQNIWGESPELENHQVMMTSRSFLEQVAESFSPEEVEQIVAPYRSAEPESPEPSVQGIVAGSIQVEREGQLFLISARHRDPAAAALIANRHPAQYIDKILARTGTGNATAIDFLEKQAAALRAKISAAEQELADYRSRYNLVSLEENQNIIVSRLKAISERRTAARMEQLNLESLVEQVEEEPEAAALTEIPAVARYGSVQEILSRKKAAEAEFEELSLRYLEAHPRILETVSRLEQIDGQLEREVRRAVRDLQNQKDSVDRQIARLDSELQAAEQEALTLDKRAVEYNVLKRQLQSDGITFDQVVHRLNQTNLSAQMDTTNFRILDTALPPGAPSEPNKKQAIAVAGFLFLAAFFGLPLLIEALDSRLKSAYDVESFVGKPLLADLPHVKEVEKGDHSPNLLLDDSDEVVTEGFRSFLSAIQLHSPNETPKVILVTSTRPEEGKSFVSSNLATALSRHGLRCLLVDSDLRRPTLHRHFDLRNDKGILNWYEGRSRQGADAAPAAIDPADPELGIRTLAEGFDFLPAGGSTKRTTELFDSADFEGLVQRLRGQYDVVVLDTPPISVFSDAVFLTDFADEVLYVARFNAISRFKVRHFIQRLDGAHQDKVLGVVINGRTSARGQRYGYDYAYSYYSSDYKYYKAYAAETQESRPRRTSLSRRSTTPNPFPVRDDVKNP